MTYPKSIVNYEDIFHFESYTFSTMELYTPNLSSTDALEGKAEILMKEIDLLLMMFGND